MAAFRDEYRKHFPLKSIADVVHLFRTHLNSGRDPDLSLLSIVTGMIENSLTLTSTGRQTNAVPTEETGTVPEPATNFPTIEADAVEKLYKKFQNILSVADVRSSKSRTASTAGFATREIIKRVSDIVWNSLIRSSYKDRAHLQSLYSYLSGSKLDCFGVAFAVVAGCQILGFADVHLAISEDHAWVVFGKNSDETIEVTWHGRGSDDKRGQPITSGVESHSWLYLAGRPVVCDRYMEVAALVSAINPSLNMTSACMEIEELQQQLLWLLYDLGHLRKYPMGLGSLGELEEVSPTVDRPSCAAIYAASVVAAREHYRNHHVYPYTYQGGYHYRKNEYREAFSAWADAGDVIRLYNYSRDDEEIYKEFMDIANELIPQVMKTESSGHSARSILRDPHCFANLLRFYDGICQWEEGSLTPILHIGWAKPLVNTISKFDYDIRSQVVINCECYDEESANLARVLADAKELVNNNNINNNNIIVGAKIEANGQTVPLLDAKDAKDTKDAKSVDESLLPTLEALTAACGEKILNPDFLLQGGGQPFTDTQGVESSAKSPKSSPPSVASVIEKAQHSPESIPQIVVPSELPKKVAIAEVVAPVSPTEDVSRNATEETFVPKRPVITLYSHKMKGLKDLLLAEKLNTHAISLQVTAQSQVQVGGKKSRHSSVTGIGSVLNATVAGSDADSRPKRTRRE